MDVKDTRIELGSKPVESEMVHLFKMCMSDDNESKVLALEIIKNMPKKNFSGLKVYMLSRIRYTSLGNYQQEIKQILDTVGYKTNDDFILDWVKVQEIMLNHGTCEEEYQILAKVVGYSFQTIFDDVDPGLTAMFRVHFTPNV
jgi:hypothetical protein